MPVNIVKPGQEKQWQQAKELAEKNGHKENWPYIVGIFKKLTGKTSSTYFKNSGEASSYSIRAGEDGNYMTVQHLEAMKDHATKLLEIVDENTPLPDWLIAKINKANTYLLDATEYLMHGHGHYMPKQQPGDLEAKWGDTMRPKP